MVYSTPLCPHGNYYVFATIVQVQVAESNHTREITRPHDQRNLTGDDTTFTFSEGPSQIQGRQLPGLISILFFFLSLFAAHMDWGFGWTSGL
jgi:hypothetical protein